MPPSEDEASLDDDEFVVPSDPAEQEHFKRRLLATASSLKKKQQQLRADQDLLADRWTEVLAAEEYELERPSKRYPKRRLLPRLEEEAPTSCNTPDSMRQVSDSYSPSLPCCVLLLASSDFVAIVRIRSSTLGSSSWLHLLHGLVLLPCGISGKMTITLDLTTIIAMLVASFYRCAALPTTCCSSLPKLP